MKKDQYIPHEVSMRSNAEVFNMVEAEGQSLEINRAQKRTTQSKESVS